MSILVAKMQNVMCNDLQKIDRKCLQIMGQRPTMRHAKFVCSVHLQRLCRNNWSCAVIRLEILYRAADRRNPRAADLFISENNRFSGPWRSTGETQGGNGGRNKIVTPRQE